MNNEWLLCWNSYRDNFDDESPFHPNTSTLTDGSTTAANDHQTKPTTCEQFQEETKELFVQMIKEIKVRCKTNQTDCDSLQSQTFVYKNYKV